MLKKIKQFFFPDDSKLKVEATSSVYVKNTKLAIHREFYTFRSLLSFIWGEYFIGRARQEAKANGFQWGTKYWMLDLQRGAVAFDAATSQPDLGTFAVSSITYAHTCTGANGLLLVGVAKRDFSVPATTLGITYNSVAMTNYKSSATFSADPFVRISSLINPTTGSNNVVITYDANCDYTCTGAVSFSGAHQTTPLGTAVLATGSDTTPTVDVSSAADEIVIDVLGTSAIGNTDTAPTVGAGQTGRVSTVCTISNDGVSERLFGMMSTETGAATTTMSWSNVGSRDWAIIGVSVKPAGATATAVNNWLLMGA